MSSMIVDGSDRQKKYPTKVNVDSRNKNEGEKITVIKDKSQRPGKINGILIDASGLKTTIEFSKSNEKFINPVLNALEGRGKFPWNRTYQGSSITTRIGGLEDSEIDEIEDLIKRTIRLYLKTEA